LGGAATDAALVAVAVCETADGAAPLRQVEKPAVIEPVAALDAERREAGSGTIHIQLRKARLRIEGSADPAALRVVLEALRG
jgi:hypothetical protein